MKAAVYTQYGTPEQLSIQEVPTPEPLYNEVLIKVHASSINSWDWDLLTGKPFLVRVIGGLRKPKRTIIGADVAGVVVAVGDEVTDFKVGDEVFGDLSAYQWGGLAEYVCTTEETLALKHPHMSFEEAASLPQAGVLAIQGLHKNLKRGSRVLINGAGGGVGTIGLQYAKSLGVEVTCVDKKEKLGMLTAMGADHVIDYLWEDYTQNGKQYDLILDVVAHRSVYDYRRALTDDGLFLYVGGNMGKLLLQFAIVAPFLNRRGRKKLKILTHKPSRNYFELLNHLYDDGVIKPVIDKVYPLDDIVAAFRYFGEGQVRGKVVIKM